MPPPPPLSANQLRLYLLPISTRRALIYCQKTSSAQIDPQKKSWPERMSEKVSRTWASWENKDSGWQKMTVDYGNKLLRRIPYEEWSLKSVPPLTGKRRRLLDELVTPESTSASANGSRSGVESTGASDTSVSMSGAGVKEAKNMEGEGGEVKIGKVDLLYPGKLIKETNVLDIVSKLATERQSLHRKRLIWCVIGMPLSAPFAAIPVIPNLPFFFIAYRAWSHWRALKGGEHLQRLVSLALVNPRPSAAIDEVYASPGRETLALSSPIATVPSSTNPTVADPPVAVATDPGFGGGDSDVEEAMLLTQRNAQKLVQDLKLPELGIELERAIWQVETAMNVKRNQAEQQQQQQQQQQEQDELKKTSEGAQTAGQDRVKTVQERMDSTPPLRTQEKDSTSSASVTPPVSSVTQPKGEHANKK